MNYRTIPDLAAMGTLLAILYFLRRRHPQKRVNFWIAGLLFIFLEAFAHAFYTPKGSWHVVSHLIALDSYVAAGSIFLWAAARPIFPGRRIAWYLLLNIAPILAVVTVYSFDVRTPGIYRALIVCGFVLGVASPFLLTGSWRLGRTWYLIPVQPALWGTLWFFASRGLYRDVAYTPLFVLYLAIAVGFQLSLPRKSLGKVAIVLGFNIWGLVFLLHSWVTNHPQYTDVAAQIWDMQKFLVTIGMLLVLLEDQVSSNESLAFHDYLTGLPNRRFFEDRLATALQESQRNNTRTALLVVDLDGFKLVNDTYGHDVGDELLRHIAHSLRNAVRPRDTLARLGGDEFILIAMDLPKDQTAEHLRERGVARVLAALHEPLRINGDVVSATGSIGIALYPDDATDEVLLRRIADQRMYQQKRQIPLAF